MTRRLSGRSLCEQCKGFWPHPGPCPACLELKHDLYLEKREEQAMSTKQADQRPTQATKSS